MRMSKFNVIEKLPNDKVLIFNTLSNGIVMLRGFDYEKILNREVVSAKISNNLIKNGIVLDHDLNENDLLAFRNNKAIYSTHELSLTIHLTNDCNMRCNYCFNKTSKINEYTYISDENFSSLKKWIFSRIYESKPNVINVEYLGGEPTLNIKKVIEMQTMINELKESYKFTTNTLIVTNGSNIKIEDIESLNEISLVRYQITLDGPLKIHNKRRPHVHGEDSFSNIIYNIKMIYQITKERVVIRVNIDSKNIDYIDDLLNELEENNVKDYIQLYFSRVFEVNCSINETSNTKVNFYNISLDWIFDCYLLSMNRNFNVLTKWSTLIPTNGPCKFYHINAFTIDQNGNIYKCPQLTGEKEFLIGHVANSKFNTNYVKNIIRKIDKNNECDNCVYLPQCNFGCRYQVYTEKNDVTKSICDKKVFENSIKIIKESVVLKLKKEEVI